MKSTRKVVTTASVLFAAAAFGGLMAGSARAATPPVSGLSAQGPVGIAGIPAPVMHNVDTHACKGQNDCKGQGGCSSGDNGCNGKNSCKGKGGCNTNPNPPPTQI
ncbi:MAG TPA: hypothetical protein VMG59_08575 [Phycisphaerae bacterium]|nr:hypothetical protein [Phycisphaerae bacterium]